MPLHSLPSDGDAEFRAASEGPAITARIDAVSPRGDITGWACVPDRPSQRVKVSVHGSGKLLASGLADLPRPDVGEAGFGDGNSGFALPLPARLLDGHAHLLALTAEVPGVAPLVVEITLELPRLSRAHAIARAAASAPILAVPLLSGQVDGGTAAIYVPGHYVVCMRPYPLPVYHVRGWHAPEQEFTWISGIEGTIEMLIRRPDDRYHLTLDVVPNGVGGRLQTLEVFCNGLRVGFFEVQAPARLSVELPAELFTTRKLRIGLLCENAVAVADFGVADDRRLGIAVCGWCIA